MVYNGVTYLYVLSLQGDVIRIISKTGETKAEYTYDAWGRILTATGDLAAVNPLRYRGYFYDTETGLYYLQSRYYDPTVKRFINADSYGSTGQGFLGYNMFAYCLNNPINSSDPSGEIAGIDDAAVAVCVGIVVILVYFFAPVSEKGSVFSVTGQNAIDAYSVITRQNSFGFSADNSVSIPSAKPQIISDYVEERATPYIIEKYKERRHIHHIVAQRARQAEPARRILRCVGIAINDSENTVGLSQAVHMFLHTNVYYNWVNYCITSAYIRANGNYTLARRNVIIALRGIRSFLESL